jgi:hypothetical protein
MGHKTVALNTLCKVWVLCWRNIMAGGSRSHLPLTFWDLVRAYSSWWQNKRCQIAHLCLWWFFGGIAHPTRDGVFTSDDEWRHDGAGLFVGHKQSFTTLAYPRRLAGFDEFK